MTTEILQKNNNFNNIYSKAHRLASAVFAVFNYVEDDLDLKTKIKNLSLDIVSKTVELKDANFFDTKKNVLEIEKKVLFLISLLDIASVTEVISSMNGSIIKEEFKNFIKELEFFVQNFEDKGNFSVKKIIENEALISTTEYQPLGQVSVEKQTNQVRALQLSYERKDLGENKILNKPTNGGVSRKESRKNMILNFIKGHNNVSIKDIVPNIIGCSEKTVQRELIELINEGKIRKFGERRWSRYSLI